MVIVLAQIIILGLGSLITYGRLTAKIEEALTFEKANQFFLSKEVAGERFEQFKVNLEQILKELEIIKDNQYKIEQRLSRIEGRLNNGGGRK